jgi:hypothetical protein
LKLGPGSSFPPVVLPDLAGHPRKVHEDQRRLVIFGHRDCKTTRQTLPYVDRIHRRRAGAALAVMQDEPAVARELVGELGLSLPVLLEPPPYPVAAGIGLTAVPTLVLLDEGGRVETVSEGFSRDALEGFAAALEVERPLFAPDDRSPAFRPG